MSSTHMLQVKLEDAVLTYAAEYDCKPKLLRINPNDFHQILPYSDRCVRFGLSIKGVTTVGHTGIKQGQFQLVP